MDVSYKTKAIILTRERRSSNSRVVVFSQDRGKLELVARGTDKLTSKLAAHIEPVSLSEIMVIRGKRQDYVGSAVSETAYRSLKRRWETAVTASVTLETAQAMIGGTEGDERIFSLLKAFLDALEEGSAYELKNIVLLQSATLLKLAAFLGFTPQLQRCAACNGKIAPAAVAFSPATGGLVCGSCAPATGATGMSIDAAKLIRLCLTDPLRTTVAVAASEAAVRETERAVKNWREYHLG